MAPALPPFLAAGIGSFALAVLACAGDKSAAVKNSLNFRHIRLSKSL
jgi:hypothetical protein